MPYAPYRQPREDLGQGEEYELRAPSDRPTYDYRVDAKIIGWRAECFEARGFGPAVAALLAMRRDVDRVQVERLLDQGATHRQVYDLVL